MRDSMKHTSCMTQGDVESRKATVIDTHLPDTDLGLLDGCQQGLKKTPLRLGGAAMLGKAEGGSSRGQRR